jgi:hypothetical protein
MFWVLCPINVHSLSILSITQIASYILVRSTRRRTRLSIMITSGSKLCNLSQSWALLLKEAQARGSVGPFIFGKDKFWEYATCQLGDEATKSVREVTS